jgi:hypothetical protein
VSDPRESPWQPPAGPHDPVYDQPPVEGEPSTAYVNDKVGMALRALRQAGLVAAFVVLAAVGWIVARWPGPKK